MFNPKKEFDKKASLYIKLDSIQKQVADKLCKNINLNQKIVLDLGSGSGNLYSKIGKNAKHFISVDISKNMCDLHQKADNLTIINLDFDEDDFFDKLPIDNFDIIISSSSLQWSKNLKKLFYLISKKTVNISFAIFTSNTFKNIQDFTNLSSPIYDSQEILKYINGYFNIKYEIKKYKKIFQNSFDIFQYIKQSGVSGGKNRLSIKQTRKLIDNFPYNYLEYEVLFIQGVSS